MAGEKTEAPTPKRLRDARKRGDTPKSKEIASLGVLLAPAVGLRWIAPVIAASLQDILREGFTHQPEGDLTPGSALAMGRESGFQMVLAMAPFFGLLAVAALAFNLGQSGLLLSGAKLKPRLESISPHTGLKRLYGKEGLANLARALFKMGVVALVVGITMRDRLGELAMLSQYPVSTSATKLA